MENYFRRLFRAIGRVVSVTTSSTLLSFGLWYVMFFFVTTQSNAFVWNVWTKIAYILLGALTTIALIDTILRENEK